MVRRWLRSEFAEIDAEISVIGRTAIERSAQEIARHAGGAARADSAALTTLDAIVAQLDPQPTPSRGWFGQRASAPKPDVAGLVRTIEAERDAALRAVLVLQTDRARLGDADAAVDDAVSLATTLERFVLSAAREVAPERPERATLLRGDVAAALEVRRRDLLLQQTVLRHAIDAADLAAGAQEALVETLERARTLSVGAVQTAIAARSAVGAMPPEPETPGPITSVSDAVARLNAVLVRRSSD
jgi:hypothetical protein